MPDTDWSIGTDMGLGKVLAVGVRAEEEVGCSTLSGMRAHKMAPGK